VRLDNRGQIRGLHWCLARESSFSILDLKAIERLLGWHDRWSREHTGVDLGPRFSALDPLRVICTQGILDDRDIGSQPCDPQKKKVSEAFKEITPKLNDLLAEGAKLINQ